jgi:outer membrane immunogenic protein
MKKLLVAGIAAAAFCGASALAADLPTKAPAYKAAPVAAPIFNWSGCYIGGNVGAGWQRNSVTDVTLVPNFDTGSDTGTGVVGGGQVGCDYQFANSWVIGIQGMYDWAGINGSHRYIGGASSANETLETKMPWFGTLTGRIGYAVMPQAMLYFKGGAAWVRNSYSDVDPVSVYTGDAAATRSGWTIGGGVEYAFQHNWSLFAEYAYVALGNQNAALTYSGPGFCCTYTYNEKNSLQTIIVGANYRFDMMGKAPVVRAKY